MIHPVDAPLVFSSRRHVPGSEQGEAVSRRTVYSARSTDTGPVPTSPQIRDDYRPPSNWNHLYRNMGRMPVSAEHKAGSDQFDSIDSAMAATVANAGAVKASRSKLAAIKTPESDSRHPSFPESDTLHFPAPVQTPSLEAPLELRSAELNIGQNCTAHHTEEYYVAQRAKGPQLVLRRGADFLVNLTFYRAFDPANDVLKLVFEIGKLVRPSRGE